MPIYVYECPEHGQFEKLQGMFVEHTCVCPKCGGKTKRIFSMPYVRMAIPLTFYQEMPYGKPPVEIGKIADSSRSWEPNYDIPPDYPNLTEI